MRTLWRIDTSFSSRTFKLSRRSTTSSQSSSHKPSMTGSSKKWSIPSFHTSSSKTNPKQSPYPPTQPLPPSQKPSISMSQPSSSSSSSSKPINTSTSISTPTSSKPSKRTQAWKKTKTFLSSIGEPPTAEYDRQQAALKAEKEGKVKTNGREAFGAVNYGPYHQGGPYQAGGRL